MNRNRIFWGVLLIMAGGLLLLDRTNLFRFNVWNLFWPMVIILIGGWMITKNFLPGQKLENEVRTYPVGQIETANITLKHGAGRLVLSPGSDSQHLFEGDFFGGIIVEDYKAGINADMILRPAFDSLNRFDGFPGNEGLKWDIRFNNRVHYKFILKTGAGDHTFNFRDLNVSEIDLDTGASATKITLPAHTPFTNLRVNAGAASVEVIVPNGVAAEIKINSGLSGKNVDLNRFSQIAPDHFRSRDFDQAEYRANIQISGGVGSFSVR